MVCLPLSSYNALVGLTKLCNSIGTGEESHLLWEKVRGKVKAIYLEAATGLDETFTFNIISVFLDAQYGFALLFPFISFTNETVRLIFS